MGDLPERGPLGFRDYPHRIEALQRLQRIHDARKPPVPGGKLFPIAPEVEDASERYCQEDNVMDQYGRLVRFDWLFTDEAGDKMPVTNITTHHEAVAKAKQYWRAGGYEPVGEISHTQTLRPDQGEKKEG